MTDKLLAAAKEALATLEHHQADIWPGKGNMPVVEMLGEAIDLHVDGRERLLNKIAALEHDRDAWRQTAAQWKLNWEIEVEGPREENGYRVYIWRGIYHNAQFSHNLIRTEIVHAPTELAATASIQLAEEDVTKVDDSLVIRAEAEYIHSVEYLGRMVYRTVVEYKGGE